MVGNTPRVLLIEDDPAEQRLFREAARETGLDDLAIATDGCEALEYFPEQGDGSDAAGDLPELIVLDLNLPEKDGTVVLEELKSSPTSLGRIPVIVLSNSDTQTDIDTAYDLGANAYLTKPDDYDELCALLRDLNDFWLTSIEQPSH